MPDYRPKVLLIGAGRFGLEHLAEWRRLADEGAAEIAGVVVNSDRSRDALAAAHDFPVHRGFDESLVRGVDAVDIVTPSDTHAALVRRCLPLAHVLVEKPLAMDPAEAADLGRLAASSGHVLMVGHLFRFHPVVRELKGMVAGIAESPRGIEGVMTNPGEAGAELKDPNLEFLHLFDMVDFLFGVEPDMNSGRRTACVNRVSVRYPGPMNVNLKMGWGGESKVRVLKLLYSDREITANLIDNSIVVAGRDNQVHKTFFAAEPQALREELRTFLAAVADRSVPHPDASVGERLVRIAVAARPRPEKERPTVAVIGGGIFGATCALELAKIARVSLFERHAELLTEVSFNNQFRHHSGFHYPRSYDTIAEIKATRKDFEAEYEEAIIRDFPSYFCTSATGIEIPAERYLAACMNSNLSFTLGGPPEGMVDLSKVNLCLKTDEAVYDVPRLRQLVTDRLRRNKDIRFHPGTEVTSGVDRRGRSQAADRVRTGRHARGIVRLRRQRDLQQPQPPREVVRIPRSSRCDSTCTSCWCSGCPSRRYASRSSTARSPAWWGRDGKASSCFRTSTTPFPAASSPSTACRPTGGRRPRTARPCCVTRRATSRS